MYKYIMHQYSTLSAQSTILCGSNGSKIPVLQSDSANLLRELTEDNVAAVVVQNTLEYSRCG